MIDTAKGAADDLSQKAQGVAGEAILKTAQTAGPVWDKTKDLAGDAVIKATQVAGPAVDKAKSVAGGMAGKALQAAGPAVEKTKEVAGTAGQLVGGAVGELKDRVLGHDQDSDKDDA